MMMMRLPSLILGTTLLFFVASTSSLVAAAHHKDVRGVTKKKKKNGGKSDDGTSSPITGGARERADAIISPSNHRVLMERANRILDSGRHPSGGGGSKVAGASGGKKTTNRHRNLVLPEHPAGGFDVGTMHDVGSGSSSGKGSSRRGSKSGGTHGGGCGRIIKKVDHVAMEVTNGEVITFLNNGDKPERRGGYFKHKGPRTDDGTEAIFCTDTLCAGDGESIGLVEGECEDGVTILEFSMLMEDVDRDNHNGQVMFWCPSLKDYAHVECNPSDNDIRVDTSGPVAVVDVKPQLWPGYYGPDDDYLFPTIFPEVTDCALTCRPDCVQLVVNGGFETGDIPRPTY